jgi:hypothetical protein
LEEKTKKIQFIALKVMNISLVGKSPDAPEDDICFFLQF